MLEDEGPSRVSEIARRMDLNVNNQNVHRSRLIHDELIRSAGRGLVEFAMPYLREALVRRRETGSLNLAYGPAREVQGARDRKSTRLNSSHVAISYAVFYLKQKSKRSHRN